MKFKLFKADGTSSEERDIPHFPAMEDGKGKDALRPTTWKKPGLRCPSLPIFMFPVILTKEVPSG